MSVIRVRKNQKCNEGVDLSYDSKTELLVIVPLVSAIGPPFVASCVPAQTQQTQHTVNHKTIRKHEVTQFNDDGHAHHVHGCSPILCAHHGLPSCHSPNDARDVPRGHRPLCGPCVRRSNFPSRDVLSCRGGHGDILTCGGRPYGVLPSWNRVHDGIRHVCYGDPHHGVRRRSLCVSYTHPVCELRALPLLSDPSCISHVRHTCALSLPFRPYDALHNILHRHDEISCVHHVRCSGHDVPPCHDGLSHPSRIHDDPCTLCHPCARGSSDGQSDVCRLHLWTSGDHGAKLQPRDLIPTHLRLQRRDG